MKFPLAIRKQVLLRHPRVKFVSGRNACEDYRWSRMPLKALFTDMPKHDPTLKEKYRCKKSAHYKFTANKPRSEHGLVARSGLYCWSHLTTQLMNMSEWDLFNKWWDKQPEVVEWRNTHAKS